MVSLNARTREDLERRRSSKIPPPLEAKVRTQSPARVIEGHADWIQAACLSADGATLLTGDDAGEILMRNFLLEDAPARFLARS